MSTDSRQSRRLRQRDRHVSGAVRVDPPIEHRAAALAAARRHQSGGRRRRSHAASLSIYIGLRSGIPIPAP